MSGVWMSNVYSNHRLGEKLGTRTKRYGRPWDPPTSDVPVATADELKAMTLQSQGFALPRESFPEADAVYNNKMFKKVGALFNSIGFFVARAKLAAILSQYNLGEGGGLLSFPIYREDLKTPYGENFFLINLGSRKNTIIIDQCQDAKKFYVEKETGQQVWKLNRLNRSAEVVLSASATGGADMWVEAAVHHKIFMSEKLVKALQDANLADDWSLLRCRIAEDV